MLTQGGFQPAPAVVGCMLLSGQCCRAGGGVLLPQSTPLWREPLGLMWAVASQVAGSFSEG